LFSNSFHPASSSLANQPRHQAQKAIMIVTADPRGDVNATSQILRYSALAREVTVPRVISVTQAIFPAPPPVATETTSTTTPHPVQSQQTHPVQSQQTNPRYTTHAADTAELARLRAQIALLQQNLSTETRRREEAEASWELAEQRLAETEAAVREECWNEFESRLEMEQSRQRTAWETEHEHADRHLDEKIEILTRGTAEMNIYEDNETLNPGMEGLQRENDALRQRVRQIEREKEVGRTPSRKVKVLKTKKWVLDDGLGLDVENEGMT